MKQFNNDPFTKVLGKMPEVFSSNAFTARLRKEGITNFPKNYIPNFLRLHCANYSRRMWVKQSDEMAVKNEMAVKKSLPPPPINPAPKNDHEVINSAIKFLKMHGYKVMKRIDQWEEI